MEHVVVYNGDRLDPVEWAARREGEGWSGLAMADHVSSGRGGVQWHPFSAPGAMAVGTKRVSLTTAYANNLMRSPVEYAQAALSLHAPHHYIRDVLGSSPNRPSPGASGR